VRGTRITAPIAVGLAAAALALSVHSLRTAPDAALVAQAWPATAVLTAMLLLFPARHRRISVGVVALIVIAACLVAGRGLLFTSGFALANAVEVLVVLRWLRAFEIDRPQLRTSEDYRRWLIGVFTASSLAATIIAITTGLTGGDALWRPFVWVTLTHLGAMVVALPLVMSRPRHRIRVSPAEVASHLVLILLVGLACVQADRSEPVAFLMLPLLMWAGARFSPRWASLELLAVAFGMSLLDNLQLGPFGDVTRESSLLEMMASSQAFVAIAAITSVAFSVATGHLYDSRRRIREHEVQLGQLLDSASGTAFIATDLEGLITWFSPGAEQLLGYTGQEVVGRITPMSFHEYRELQSRADQLGVAAGYGVVTHRVAQGTDQDTQDWTYLHKDGSRLTVSVSVTAVRDDDGRPQSFLSVVRDVTDRRAAEQALVFALDKERETNQRMLELDRAKGEFVSTVSHELRTPLTSIIGYTELLADDLSENLTEVQCQLVERIDRNGERLLELVEDLLHLARVEDGSLRLVRARTDLCGAVRAGTDEVRADALKGGISLRVRTPGEPVLLDGDSDYLTRLVLNLVDNAVKFSSTGGSVEVRLEGLGDVAELRVIDTGMGIPVAEQPRVFQRFFRSSLSTEYATQGSGLGLHIVRSIAEAHEGRIDFESTPGSGSTFVFVVPLSGSRSGVGDQASAPQPAEPQQQKSF
jgi:PAS domain S-box-containing protein